MWDELMVDGGREWVKENVGENKGMKRSKTHKIGERERVKKRVGKTNEQGRSRRGR